MPSITMIFGEIETCHTCKYKQPATDTDIRVKGKGVFWCDAKATYKRRSVRIWKCRKWEKAERGE